MGKRQAGFGAVYRRRDGRWESQIRIPGGRRRSFYGHSRRDLIHKLADARWALGEGLPVSAGTQSLRAYLEYWLMVCRSRLRPITMVTYARDVRRLTAALGDVPLRHLTPGLIQAAYASLLQMGFSKRTVEKTHAVLHRALDQARHWGLTARNPITGGSMTHLIGIFYAPQCQVSITGGSGTSLDGQLVAYNVVITGGSGTAVNFNAQYLPRVAARLTQ